MPLLERKLDSVIGDLCFTDEPFSWQFCWASRSINSIVLITPFILNFPYLRIWSKQKLGILTRNTKSILKCELYGNAVAKHKIVLRNFPLLDWTWIFAVRVQPFTVTTFTSLAMMPLQLFKKHSFTAHSQWTFHFTHTAHQFRCCSRPFALWYPPPLYYSQHTPIKST